MAVSQLVEGFCSPNTRLLFFSLSVFWVERRDSIREAISALVIQNKLCTFSFSSRFELGEKASGRNGKVFGE